MVLSELNPMQSAKVLALPEDSEAILSLVEQGIVPECELTLMHKALFGGPIAVMVDNTKLALSRALAGQIKVEPCQ